MFLIQFINPIIGLRVFKKIQLIVFYFKHKMVIFIIFRIFGKHVFVKLKNYNKNSFLPIITKKNITTV